VAASTASSGATARLARRPDLEPERRKALLATKLGALVSERWPDASPHPEVFPGGAALVDGATAYLLLDDGPSRSLGAALAWADKRGATDVHLIADHGTGVLARRAALFAPAPAVWRVEGRSIVDARPEPVPLADPPPDAPELAAVLIDAGLEVVVEDGALIGEVNGLEVARVTRTDDSVELSTGVGRFDREASTLMHGHLAPSEAVQRVAQIVRAQRQPGAEPHPLNQLVPERWLRARLIAEPALVGLSELHAAPSVPHRANLKDRGVACAIGEGSVVVCSVGIDLDLVPSAADARAHLAPDGELVLVVPERDDHPVTRSLAARLRLPATIITIPGDWRAVTL
jgi:hypothetical protein